MQGVLVPRLLDPTVYGIYKTFLLIPTYVRAGHLGAVSGLSRQIPYYTEARRRRPQRRSASPTRFRSDPLCSAASCFSPTATISDMRHASPLDFPLLRGQRAAEQASKPTHRLRTVHRRFPPQPRAKRLQFNALAVLGAWKFGFMGVIVATAIDGVVTLMYRWTSGISFPGFRWTAGSPWTF